MTEQRWSHTTGQVVNPGALRRCLAAVALTGAATVPLGAYVDPGFAAALYQALYVLIFGGLAAVLLAPWRALTGFVRRVLHRDRSSGPDSAE